MEIGHTWYGRTCQRSHVNTACKLLLLRHAFDTLGCKVVGLRTDNFNAGRRNVLVTVPEYDLLCLEESR